jgi:hypothetical protein
MSPNGFAVLYVSRQLSAALSRLEMKKLKEQDCQKAPAGFCRDISFPKDRDLTAAINNISSLSFSFSDISFHQKMISDRPA